LWSQADDQQDYQRHKFLYEKSKMLQVIAELSLGFLKNPKMFELKSLIMAQIERWRQA
jgi:hypothetical protein